VGKKRGDPMRWKKPGCKLNSGKGRKGFKDRRTENQQKKGGRPLVNTPSFEFGERLHVRERGNKNPVPERIPPTRMIEKREPSQIEAKKEASSQSWVESRGGQTQRKPQGGGGGVPESIKNCRRYSRRKTKALWNQPKDT